MLVSGFRLRASKDFSIPSSRFGQRGITPAFGYGAPHPSAGGTLTLLIHALLSAHYEPLRHPRPPACPSRASRWQVPHLASGLPVLRTLLVVHAAPLPRWIVRVHLSLLHPRGSLPRYGRRVGPHIVLFEACSRSLTLRPAHSRGHQFVARYTEGFSHFVSSMTAPVASGWSGCRPGFPPGRAVHLAKAHITICTELRLCGDGVARIQLP